MSRKTSSSKRGGEINWTSSTAPMSSQLENTHIDQRILPLFKDRASRNVSIQSKYYQIIQPTGQNMSSQTQNFHIDADSETMISLSESYFTVNLSVSDGIQGSNTTQNYSLAPFASHLFISDLKTRINSNDISDNRGGANLYGYSAFLKSLLTKSGEKQTWLMPASLLPIGTTPQYIAVNGISSEEPDASTKLECIGLGTQTTDNSLVSSNEFKEAPGVAVVFQNLNACYQKNLITPYPFSDIAFPTTNPNFEFIFKPKDGAWTNLDYLPTGLSLDIQLQLASSYLNYMICQETTDVPIVALNSINLYLCRVKPKDDSLLAVNMALNTSPFSYPINYSRIETYTLNAGATNANISCLNGIIPNSVMCLLVPTICYNRTSTLSSPFSSGNLSFISAPIINRLWAIIGGQKFPQQDQYLSNVSVSPYMSSAKSTYDEYRKMCIDYNHPFMSFLHWINNYQVFCINTTNDDNPLFSSTDDTKTGNVNLKIEFGKAGLGDSYTLIVMALQRAEFAVDKSRNVIKNGYS